jgi:type IV pilus assembly protein PilM
MSILARLRHLVADPPPEFAFEIGPAGIAHWQASGGVRFEPIVLDFDNMDADALSARLREVTPSAGGNAKRAAAVVLPDRCARVSLMDFDQFPRKAEEQASLVRFRLKRTVPFDVETAVVRYQVFPRGGSKVEVLVAAMAVETLAPVEAAFRRAGFHPGYVTVSGLSQASLGSDQTVVLRLCGRTFTLSYFEGEELRLFRSLELGEGTLDEILGVVDPTLAYLEDERQRKPLRVDVCGLASVEPELGDHLRSQWNVPVQVLRSQVGKVEAHNAGLMGYLEAAGVA